jgi:hypothetical protein
MLLFTTFELYQRFIFGVKEFREKRPSGMFDTHMANIPEDLKLPKENMDLSQSPVLRKWKLYMSLLILTFYGYSIIGLRKHYLRE